MPDTYDAVMAGCRLLMERMTLSKGELAQFLRSVADVLELEAIYTDDELKTTDEKRMRTAADALMAATPAIIPATATPCKKKGCPGHMRYVKNEYGSLSDGGSYEIWDCTVCGHRIYDQMPD